MYYIDLFLTHATQVTKALNQARQILYHATVSDSVPEPLMVMYTIIPESIEALRTIMIGLLNGKKGYMYSDLPKRMNETDELLTKIREAVNKVILFTSTEKCPRDLEIKKSLINFKKLLALLFYDFYVIKSEYRRVAPGVFDDQDNKNSVSETENLFMSKVSLEDLKEEVRALTETIKKQEILLLKLSNRLEVLNTSSN
jgi:hypothetical protein